MALLFDGKTLEGWHVFQQPDALPAWVVNDGTLTLNPGASGVQHGDLATDKTFEDYILTFEWQSPENGNSGLFINVQEDPEHLIVWQTGPEYQLLGTEHADNTDVTKRAASIFGFTSAFPEANVKGNEEWNQSVIKQVDGKVEFFLNGKQTTSVDFTSEQWKARVAESRLKDYPGFSAATKGHIVLQEWTSPIVFRNMKIKAL